MRESLAKSMRYGQILAVIYLSKNGVITKRRIKVTDLQKETFQAYCFTRNAKRTFLIDNVLACIPIIPRERDVI
ncbi:transcriptional regulator [Psychrobacillus vulpis]|uniref:Transcriptional regulator n=1 Tax=Psychrobacillus vulpis TaxID=2325572 RepID=A0A544TUB6_9BACI|nr:transcriptional regulator [Psychrobacillus vulpis]TQR21037.1 transcriptional regulator [Psychrobacillus vulpis]